jgi:hypothetical protein
MNINYDDKGTELGAGGEVKVILKICLIIFLQDDKSKYSV